MRLNELENKIESADSFKFIIEKLSKRALSVLISLNKFIGCKTPYSGQSEITCKYWFNIIQQNIIVTNPRI